MVFDSEHRIQGSDYDVRQLCEQISIPSIALQKIFELCSDNRLTRWGHARKMSLLPESNPNPELTLIGSASLRKFSKGLEACLSCFDRVQMTSPSMDSLIIPLVWVPYKAPRQ